MKTSKFFWRILPTFPAVILTIIFLGKLIAYIPDLGRNVPLHFDWSGPPYRQGSPWEIFFVFFSLLLILASNIIISYLWTTAERDKKSFNWLSPLLTIPAARLTTVYWMFLDVLIKKNNSFEMSWPFFGGVVIVATVTALMLEWFRPFIPNSSLPYTELKEKYVPQVESQLRHFKENGRFTYWESQDPLIARVGLVVLIVVLSIQSINNHYLLLVALPIIFLYGGFRVWVTADRVMIKLGILGIPLRHMKLNEITQVTIHEFSPLKDFGGWGIRIGRGGIVGFYYTGRVGVLIEDRRGRKTLIGSDNPARLAAVIEKAQRINLTNPN